MLATLAARAARAALTALDGRAREPLPLAQQAGCEEKSLFGGVVAARSSRPRLLIGPVGVACSALCKLRSSLIVRPASARGRAKRCNPLRPCYSPLCVGCLPGLPWDSAGVDAFSPHSRSFRRDRLEYADFLLVAPQLLSQKRAISLTCRLFSVF